LPACPATPVQPPQEELFKLLKQNFDAAYDGNRAPFPVFLHAPWFTAVRCLHPPANVPRPASSLLQHPAVLPPWAYLPQQSMHLLTPTPLLPAAQENSEGLLEFMKYAADKDDVWFVTVSQLIDWMKNPGGLGRARLQGSRKPAISCVKLNAGPLPCAALTLDATLAPAVPASEVGNTLRCSLVELAPPSERRRLGALGGARCPPGAPAGAPAWFAVALHTPPVAHSRLLYTRCSLHRSH
jgi:hypothetical protein